MQANWSECHSKKFAWDLQEKVSLQSIVYYYNSMSTTHTDHVAEKKLEVSMAILTAETK